MGFVSWYMSLFEKKEKPIQIEKVAKDTAPAVNTDKEADVSFDSHGLYLLDLGNGYKIAMRKENQPGHVTIAASGPGIENWAFISHMKMVCAAISRGNNNTYSQKVFYARVSLKHPVADLDRLRDAALAYIDRVRSARQMWDEI